MVARAQAVPPGTIITNTAQASFLAWGTDSSISSNTVSLTTTWRRTPSRIDLLQYAPSVEAAEMVPVQATGFSSSSVKNDATRNSAVVFPAGSTAAIDLGAPVPLIPAAIYHQGEPIFFRITDEDQNLNPLTRESVWILVTSPATGDTELLLLSEAEPNCGIFTGFLQSSGMGPVQVHDGLLGVIADSQITAQYTDATDTTDTISLSVMVDPYGLVFNSGTGLPVNDITLTLIDAATGQPALVYGDDGISIFPATVTSGGTFTDGSGKVYAFPNGAYRFPFVAPGAYRLAAQPQTAYAAPSIVPTIELQALPGAPFAIAAPGSRGEDFVLNPGPALRIDIPVDPIFFGLWIRKNVNQEKAAVGDFIHYTLNIENVVDSDAAGVSVFDRLPPGFRFRKGSTRLDHQATGDPAISADGRTLTFNAGDLPARAAAQIRYVAEIGAGARPGKAWNTARATSVNHLQSNTASAVVTVYDDLFRSKAFIVGRVIADNCGDLSGEIADGVAGVRIYLEDGTYGVTDDQGRYHFEGVSPGAHVVQLDPESLPQVYEMSDCEENTRSAGAAFSHFVDLQGGTLWRQDFYVRTKPLPAGEASLKMVCGLCEKTVTYDAEIDVRKVALDNVRLSVILPDGTQYIPGTSRLSGRVVDDPHIMDQVLTYRLGDMAAGQWHAIRFQVSLNDSAKPGRLHTKGLLTFNTPKQKNQRSEVIDTVLLLTERRTLETLAPIVVRPHFESLSDGLLPEGQATLDQMVRQLIGLDIEHVAVTGHTDNLPIRTGGRAVFEDNEALSLARAKRVAIYMSERLNLTADQMTVSGKGDAQPLAANDTDKGRALNRRVEVTVLSIKVTIVHDVATLKCEDQNITHTQGVHKADRIADQDSFVETAPVQDFDRIDLESLTPVFDWLMPAIDFYPAIPSLKIAVQHGPGETIELRLDGRPVSPFHFDGAGGNRSGQISVSFWRGVDLHEGDNVLTAIRKGADGKEMDRIERTVHYSRSPVQAALVNDASRLIANGKHAPVVAIRLTDKDGHPARYGILGDFTVLPPYSAESPIDEMRDGLSRTDQDKPRFAVGRDGIARIRLQPTTQTGQVVIKLQLDGREEEIRVWLAPEARDWILVGLAEGTAGYHMVSGNMEQLAASDGEPDFYQDGRLAFFAKGKIKGQWLLTAAFDSARDKDDDDTRLFQTIDPDTYYTLYGDTTRQQYEAASISKLYLKIERERFYALFGDFETGLTVTELSRYSRRFNGLKSEYNGARFGYSAFAADTNQAYVRDEIQGNGTSGLYHLSRRNLEANSEQVTLQVRDRFRSDIVISSRTLTRFVDYSIDYQAGTLFFKAPVYSRDENFNPIFIVAEYESADSQDQSYTYGGRGAVKLWDQRLEVGATAIHESPANAEAELGGLDAAVDLGRGFKAKAELAATRREVAGEEIDGQSYLAEVRHASEKIDGRIYFRELGEGFGLGQQNGSETATRKVGLDAAWRFAAPWTLAGEAYRYDYLASGAQRDFGEAGLIYRQALYSLSAGLRLAEDRFEDDSTKRSTQLLAGASRLFFNNRLQTRLTHEQSLGGKDESIDFPTRTIVGADVKIADPVTVFGEHEITQGAEQDSQSSRIGVKSTPWRGGRIGTSMDNQIDENGERLFANLGLFQSWQINPRWSVDGGLDRSQTVRSVDAAPFNPNVPTAAGTSEDFTAITFGLGYRAEWWSWTGRLENRWADSQDQLNLVGGIVGEVRPGLGLSAGIKIFDSRAAAGTDTLDGDIRFSLAWRPRNTAWIVFDRLDLKFKDQFNDRVDGNGTDGSSTRRIVNHFNANYKPAGRLQLALQYGAKYVFDTIDDADYSGFTDLVGVESRYDLCRRWDVGLQVSMLHTWQTAQLDYRTGLSIGYALLKNTWVSLGYNFFGFQDEDFSAADFTAQGPFIKFRVKFDQQSVKELVSWFDRR